MNKWKVTNPNTTFVVVDEKFGHFIAECSDTDSAHLVAAAPELLEALENLLEVCYCTNECDPEDMSCASNVARKAIEKARGAS